MNYVLILKAAVYNGLLNVHVLVLYIRLVLKPVVWLVAILKSLNPFFTERWQVEVNITYWSLQYCCKLKNLRVCHCTCNLMALTTFMCYRVLLPLFTKTRNKVLVPINLTKNISLYILIFFFLILLSSHYHKPYCHRIKFE